MFADLGIWAVVLIVALAILGLIVKYGGERARRKQAEHDAEMMRRVNDALGEPLPTDPDAVRDLLLDDE